MAHYALINSNNIVVQVITGVDENITQTDTNGTIVGGTTLAWEQFYASQPQFAGLTCKRTSYNGNIVQIMLVLDINMIKTLMYLFHHNHILSWKLNYTTYQWEAPVAMPDEVEGYIWKWSEINKEWIQIATTTRLKE
jgi:hypothetical protein